MSQCGQNTEVRFASLLSGGFTTMAVINPPEKKLANPTSVCSGLQIFFNHPEYSNSSIFLIWWQTIKRKYWFLVFPAHTKASIPLLRDRFPFGTITQWGQKNSTRIWICNQICLVSYFVINCKRCFKFQQKKTFKSFKNTGVFTSSLIH